MKTKRAGALLFAIITAFVLSLVGATIVLVTTNQYRMINSEINRTIAFYRAQAGMEYAIWNAYTNGISPGSYTIKIGEQPVTISITEGGLSNYTIHISTNYTS